MATTQDYIEFVMDSLRGINNITFRYHKMFGEYCLYANDKPISLVCDNTVYIKMLPQLEPLMAQAKTNPPYKSAKPHYILDIENSELTEQVIILLETITPLPKPKKQKPKKA